MRRSWRCAAVLMAVAGCSETDPYSRAGMWQPNGANSRNLAAMVQNPYDLLRGRGEPGSSGWEAAPPVGRLWAGRTTPLSLNNSQGTPPIAGGAAPAAPAGTAN